MPKLSRIYGLQSANSLIRQTAFLLISSTLLLSLSKALPQPAASFQSWTKSGSPMLYISPAYHSINASDGNTAQFVAIPQARYGGIGLAVLDESLSLNPTMKIPSFNVPLGHGVTIFPPINQFDLHTLGNETVWLITYPYICSSLPSRLQVYSFRIGDTEWVTSAVNTASEKTKVGRYLGSGFPYEYYDNDNSTSHKFIQYCDYETRIYSFGGLCSNSSTYYGNDTSESFSNLMIQLDNKPQVRELPPMAVQSFLPSNESHPVPEAGFSMTPLPRGFMSNDGNESQSVVILGGYTTNLRFAGFSQISIYTVPSETWMFVDADIAKLSATYAPTSRIGHTAVLSSDCTKLVVFGGWVGDVFTAADPYMLILNIGNDTGGWSWSLPGSDDEAAGDRPDAFGLWGHTATLLEGNIMLISSGFIIGANGTSQEPQQIVNTETFLYNITSGIWISSYQYPLALLSDAALEESQPAPQPIIILVCIFGSLFTMTMLIILFAFCFKHRKYKVVANPLMTGKFSQTLRDFELDKVPDVIDVDAIPVPSPVQRYHRDDSDTFSDENASFLQLYIRSPEAPSITVEEAQPNKDVDILEWNRRHKESDMVTWVRNWANADVAAVAAAILEKTKRFSNNCRHIGEHTETSPISEATEPTSNEGNTKGDQVNSSQSSDQVSTLSSSEIYDSPTNDYGYPIPPMLLSAAQAFGKHSPRRPRLFIGAEGMIAPLPRRMAAEFASPTFIPRDSLTGSAYTSYPTTPYGSAPVMQSQPSCSSADTVLQMFMPTPAIEQSSQDLPAFFHSEDSEKPLSVTPSKSPGPALQSRIETLRHVGGPGTFEAVDNVSRSRTSSPNLFAPETYLSPLPLVVKAPLQKPTTEIERLRQMRLKQPSTPNLLRKSRPNLEDRCRTSNSAHANSDSIGRPIGRSSFTSLKRRGQVMLSLSKSQRHSEPKTPAEEEQQGGEVQNLGFVVERRRRRMTRVPSPDVSISDAELEGRVAQMVFGGMRDGPLRVVNASPVRISSTSTMEMGKLVGDGEDRDHRRDMGLGLGLLQERQWVGFKFAT